MKTNLRKRIVVLLFLLTLVPAQAFYNPTTGRWLSRDPLGEDGGANEYAFVANDPKMKLIYLEGTHPHYSHLSPSYHILVMVQRKRTTPIGRMSKWMTR